MPKKYVQTRYCLYCGPRIVKSQPDQEKHRRIDSIVCPTCHLDHGETRLIEEVRSIGFEEAYRREWRRNNGGG